MSDRAQLPNRTRRDRGFTLIEMLIVISMIGFLTATLAAVFSVVVRTTPDADERVNDARSLKGLVTWIPQDMDATPPDGFDTRPDAWPCAGTAPGGYNVVAMSWTEVGAATTEFHASYRYQLREGDWVIARYACQGSQPARRVNMTSALPAWIESSPPVRVDMCSTTIDDAGNCPTASVVSDPSTQPVESMKVTITLLNGRTYTIDAAAKNPHENLADDPDAVTNLPPKAGTSTHSMTMFAGDTEVIENLYTTFAVSDPEGDYLTSAVDSYETLPTGVTVTSSDPLKVIIVADGLAPVGTHEIPLIVSDAYGGSVNVKVLLTINQKPNVAPVATTPSYTLMIRAGETVVLPLNLSHGVSDPNGDPLTLAVSSWPAPLSNKPVVGSSLAPLQMEVTVKPGEPAGPVADPIRTIVNDGRGGSIEVLTFLNITAPAANNPPAVSPLPNPAAIVTAGDKLSGTPSFTVVASDPNGDVIWVAPGSPIPTGLTVTVQGMNVTVAADELTAPGTYSLPLLVYDVYNASTPVTATIEVRAKPIPPSTCVLGDLTVEPGTVGRSGTGEGPRVLDQDVLVTLTVTGNCYGLVLKYDTGNPSGLGAAVGRPFPNGSPTKILIRGDSSGGSEKWTKGAHLLTASTTSSVSPNSVSTTLIVN